MLLAFKESLQSLYSLKSGRETKQQCREIKGRVISEQSHIWYLSDTRNQARYVIKFSTDSYNQDAR